MPLYNSLIVPFVLVYYRVLVIILVEMVFIFGVDNGLNITVEGLPDDTDDHIGDP